jgi:GTP-binding protein
VGAWRTIRGELKAYGEGLEAEPELVALNKVDALSPDARAAAASAMQAACGAKVWLVSAVSGEGVRPLLRQAFARVRRKAEATAKASAPVEPWSP